MVRGLLGRRGLVSWAGAGAVWLIVRCVFGLDSAMERTHPSSLQVSEGGGRVVEEGESTGAAWERAGLLFGTITPLDQLIMFPLKNSSMSSKVGENGEEGSRKFWGSIRVLTASGSSLLLL
ncbi:unnamed protein product [Pleuronectes platessa]|uniref:Uncharacterized protein n=1 Tax=Pleuronectes platessa TaxID=8262 RepID=A0A9N7TMQ5_PLEPL|nr:unnamed protein product [Pleuronectes platessa]